MFSISLIIRHRRNNSRIFRDCYVNNVRFSHNFFHWNTQMKCLVAVIPYCISVNFPFLDLLSVRRFQKFHLHRLLCLLFKFSKHYIKLCQFVFINNKLLFHFTDLYVSCFVLKLFFWCFNLQIGVLVVCCFPDSPVINAQKDYTESDHCTQQTQPFFIFFFVHFSLPLTTSYFIQVFILTFFYRSLIFLL